MEKQESKSKWDDLARELGAEIPPETVQREEAVLQASQEESAAPAAPSREKSKVAHAPLPKRGTGDWDSLASDLGLPPTESLAPPSPPKSETPREETRPAPRPQKREETHARRPERHEGERKPRREQSEHRRDDRGRRGQRDHRGPRREDRDRETDVDVDRGRQRHRDEMPTPEPEVEQAYVVPTPAREQPQKPPTVSLWHKIFGSPAEQTPKMEEETSIEPVAPSDLRDEPRAAGSGFADAHAGEPIELRDDFGQQNRAIESSGVSEEDISTEHKRGRPRRRRGGRGRGRGRDSEDRPRESQSAERGDAAPRPERARPEDDDVFGDDLSLGDEETDDSLGDSASTAEDENGAAAAVGSSRSASALQRAIPSWDEAIGFIVDSNMQSRSQRRPPSRSGSRDNSSRGRSRGRRKS